MKNFKNFEQFTLNNEQSNQVIGGTIAIATVSTFSSIGSVSAVSTNLPTLTVGTTTALPTPAPTVTMATGGDCWVAVPMLTIKP